MPMANKVVVYLGVLLAIAATFAPDAFMYYGLGLVVLGLVQGLMNPTEDTAKRVAYYVVAFALPMMADNLDAIPVAGAYLNAFLDQMAVYIAGIALANVLVQVKNMVASA